MNVVVSYTETATNPSLQVHAICQGDFVDVKETIHKDYNVALWLTGETTTWHALADGTVFAVGSPTILHVYEKYSKPGRVYGQTPKRKLVRVYEVITYAGTVINVGTTKTAAAAPRTSDAKCVSYASVMEELKQKLAEKEKRKHSTTIPPQCYTKPTVKRDVFNADAFIDQFMMQQTTMTPVKSENEHFDADDDESFDSSIGSSMEESERASTAFERTERDDDYLNFWAVAAPKYFAQIDELWPPTQPEDVADYTSETVPSYQTAARWNFKA